MYNEIKRRKKGCQRLIFEGFFCVKGDVSFKTKEKKTKSGKSEIVECSDIGATFHKFWKVWKVECFSVCNILSPICSSPPDPNNLPKS